MINITVVRVIIYLRGGGGGGHDQISLILPPPPPSVKALQNSYDPHSLAVLKLAVNFYCPLL